MPQFGSTDGKIKRLEDEIQSLKARLDEKTEQYLKVWERDSNFNILIDEVLENPESKHALKVLNIIKQGLNFPDDFKATAVNKEEVDQLTQEIEELRISNQDYEAKLRDLERLNEINVKNLNNDNANLEASWKKLEKDLADTKAYYEKKMTELMWKNDQLNEEKEFRKFQLKKHQENSKIVNKENEKENQGPDKVQKLLIKIARLEGQLLNKDKELNSVLEKVEFYRNQYNKCF